MSFLLDAGRKSEAIADIGLFFAGDLSVLKRPAIAIVGTRNASHEGAARARRLAKELALSDVTVVSGLAAGIDTHALTSAIRHGGRAAAVIGTPLDKAYPAENKALQEEIYTHHCLISQFPSGARVFKANFPQRNRVMAAVTDGSVIVEASDTSGTLHQAAECVRLNRWLFLVRSVVENKSINWPAKFLGYSRTVIVDRTEDILNRAGDQ